MRHVSRGGGEVFRFRARNSEAGQPIDKKNSRCARHFVLEEFSDFAREIQRRRRGSTNCHENFALRASVLSGESKFFDFASESPRLESSDCQKSFAMRAAARPLFGGPKCFDSAREFPRRGSIKKCKNCAARGIFTEDRSFSRSRAKFQTGVGDCQKNFAFGVIFSEVFPTWREIRPRINNCRKFRIARQFLWGAAAFRFGAKFQDQNQKFAV